MYFINGYFVSSNSGKEGTVLRKKLAMWFGVVTFTSQIYSYVKWKTILNNCEFLPDPNNELFLIKSHFSRTF